MIHMAAFGFGVTWWRELPEDNYSSVLDHTYLYPGYRAPSAEQKVRVETSTRWEADNDGAPPETADTPLPYGREPVTSRRC